MPPSAPKNDPISGNKVSQPAQVVPCCGCLALYLAGGIGILLLWLLPKFGFQDGQEVGVIAAAVWIGGALLGNLLGYILGGMAQRAEQKPDDGSIWHAILTSIPTTNDPGPPD